MLKICIVKQTSCYDLFTKTGPNLIDIVNSSNWRSGPIGLWDLADCHVVIVNATTDRECTTGKKLWGKYVTNWTIWPEGGKAENVEAVDWSLYDIVIAIDVAVPTRIIRQFRTVLWCYYFIEGGPTGIDTIFRGSPFYGYNVFLNHRPAKFRLSRNSAQYMSMVRTKRAVLDFPYYIQSSTTIQNLYKHESITRNSCIFFSHHSYSVLQQSHRVRISRYGTILDSYKSISDIHKLELRSKYFIVHPDSKPCAGLALVEAISAGCLALSPRDKLWGFPELIDAALDYSDFNQLLSILDRLESDLCLYDKALRQQKAKVDTWFFELPFDNLVLILEAFKRSNCSPLKQKIFEFISAITGQILRIAAGIARRILIAQ
ncbi:MAG: hypothetical protein FD177_2227 [Desulfovibrionaceae bacterium]|nr:MAG: hypothetical protein FD177_2227 [Desulfovibrionaceae bacterium]